MLEEGSAVPLRRLVPVARPPQAKAKVVEAIAGGERGEKEERKKNERKKEFL